MSEHEHRLLRLFRKFTALPLGHWLFSRAVCWQAPYFASIGPRIEALEPGRCVVTIRDRRRVHNHIGTVHAIALCNMAELAGGLCTDVSIPASMRWIPKGMTVDYVAKAKGPMRAEAIPRDTPRASESGYELPIDVEVKDSTGQAVFRAEIRMWVSPKPSKR